MLDPGAQTGFRGAVEIRMLAKPAGHRFRRQVPAVQHDFKAGDVQPERLPRKVGPRPFAGWMFELKNRLIG
jgi:hypothetical protein